MDGQINGILDPPQQFSHVPTSGPGSEASELIHHPLRCIGTMPGGNFLKTPKPKGTYQRSYSLHL